MKFGAGAAAVVAVLLLSAFVFREACFGGQVATPADLLLRHPPWSVVERAPDWRPGNPSLSDAVSQFLPWHLFVRERLQAGHLPLWNNRAGAGQPLLANLQSAIFSPVTQLAVWLPLSWGLLAGMLLKLLVAGAGTAVLARRLGASLAASVLAGVAFAFGGFQFLWLAHPHSAVSCLLPVLLVVVERWLAGPTLVLRAVFAVLVAGLIFGGHVETALHVSAAVGLYALVASAGRPWPARVRLLFDLFAWSLVGLLLASVQWLPFLEYLQVSEAYALREGYREAWRAVPWADAPAVAGALLAGAAGWLAWRGQQRATTAGRRAAGLIGAAAGATAAVVLLARAGLPETWKLLAWPDAWGHPVPARELPWSGSRAYVNVNNGYAGIVPLAAALFMLACGRFTPSRRAVAALLALGAVAGFEVPVISQLLGRLPLFDLSLNYRFTLLVSLGLAVLGALGVDALCRVEHRRRPAVAFWTLLAVLAISVLAVTSLPAVRAAPEPPAAVPADTVAPVDPGGSLQPDAVLLGRVEPIFAPVRDGETLRVHGWAFAEGEPVVVVLVAEQGAAIRTLRVVPDRDPGPGFPPEWRDHPAASRAGLFAELDVSDFAGGSFRLRAWATRPDVADAALLPLHNQTLSRLRSHVPAPRWWGLWAGAALLIVLGSWRARPGRAIGWLAWLALLIVLADAAAFARGFHPAAPSAHVYPDTPATEWLASRPGTTRVWATRGDVLLPNTASVYGLRDLRTFDAMGLDRFARFMAMLREPGGTGLDLAHPLIGLLDLGHVLSPPDWEPPAESGLVEVLRQPDVVVWRRDRFTSRAFVAPFAESIDGYLAAVPERLHEGGVSPSYAARRHALNVGAALADEYRHRRRYRDVLAIEGDAPTMQAGIVPAAPDGFAATVIEDWREPRQQEYRVASSAPGWLFVGDSYAPGWEVTVNGEPARIVPAFIAFRAVAVPEGESLVVFRYAPAGFRLGLAGTGLALVALLAALVAGAVAALREPGR